MHLIQFWICSKANEKLIQAYFSFTDRFHSSWKHSLIPLQSETQSKSISWSDLFGNNFVQWKLAIYVYVNTFHKLWVQVLQGLTCYVDDNLSLSFHSYIQHPAKYFYLRNKAQPCNLNGKQIKRQESTVVFLKIVLQAPEPTSSKMCCKSLSIFAYASTRKQRTKYRGVSLVTFYTVKIAVGKRNFTWLWFAHETEGSKWQLV